MTGTFRPVVFSARKDGMAKRSKGTRMNVPVQWRKGPRPDPTVIELLNQLTSAARRGQVRAIYIVTVDPLLKTEDFQAGELDDVKRTLLLGGLAQACISLHKPK
jgi:hypothetical protein